MPDFDAIFGQIVPTTGTPIPQLYIFWLTCAVMMLGIFTVVYILIFDPSRFTQMQQFRLVLTLVIFPLSTISCMLFIADVKVEWNLGYALITLAGPAVLWLAALIILTVLWKQEATVTQAKRPGSRWIAYNSWKTQLGPLGRLFTGNEEQYVIREIFNNVFFRAPERLKLSSATVQTVFAYYPRADKTGMVMFKLQRLIGTTPKPSVDVYHVSSPSLPGQLPRSYLFNLLGGRIGEAIPRGDQAETWHTIRLNTIDVLILAVCPEGNPTEGDYLWVDVPKYTNDTASIAITFLSTKPISEEGNQLSRLWEVTHPFIYSDSGGSQDVDVPVIFQKIREGGARKRTANDSPPSPIFSQWMTELDRLLSDPNPRDELKAGQTFLKDALKDLCDGIGFTGANPTYSDIFSISHFPYICKLDESNLSNPVVAMFQWK